MSKATNLRSEVCNKEQLVAAILSVDYSCDNEIILTRRDGGTTRFFFPRNEVYAGKMKEMGDRRIASFATRARKLPKECF